MKVIIFTKRSDGDYFHEIESWDPTSPREIEETLNARGIIVLLPHSANRSLELILRDTAHINCQIKGKKKELFRSLKLNLKKDQNLPRKLFVKYPDIAAFKRSFNPFLKRYNSDHPCCLLFMPDGNYADLLDHYDKEEINLSDKRENISPFTNVLNIPEMKEMEKIFIGKSPDAKTVRAFSYLASKSVLPVLIIGDSGTGKEIIARMICNYSEKFNTDFVPVNCAAIPDTLFESELFGYKKGAFTDARSDKKGLFTEASSGTLFLDEIGELSLKNQAKLLRALEEKEVLSLGATKTKKINARIVAATNRNLGNMVDEGTFRRDLLERVCQFPISSPPLRSHPEDIPLIARAIWRKLGRKDKLSKEFLDFLKSYPWPGNVRELRSMLNTVHEIFKPESPRPEHIEYIRNYRVKALEKSASGKDSVDVKLLEAESKTRLITVQNIIRAIKIEVRPFLHPELLKPENKMLKDFKDFCGKEIDKLEELCREPIYFNNKVLFDRIKRFRYLIEKIVCNKSVSVELLNDFWRSEIEPLHDAIYKEIFELVWKK